MGAPSKLQKRQNFHVSRVITSLNRGGIKITHPEITGFQECRENGISETHDLQKLKDTINETKSYTFVETELIKSNSLKSAVVHFYPWFNNFISLFLGMVISDVKSGTKKSKI